MIRRLFFTFVWSACVCACVPNGRQAATANKPQYGSWGFDAAGADNTTKPGDDFFRYANGAWLDSTEIPPDKPAASLRLAMTDLTDQRLHDIMEEAAGKADHQPATVDDKVGAFYKSFMDESRVEQLGAAALEPQLDAVRAATSREELAALMGRHNSDFESGIFELFIDVDLKKPKRYTVYVTQAGLGLPDRDYYLKPDFAAQKAKYQTYVYTLLRKLRWPDEDARAKELVAFETRIAEASWTREQDRDVVATYNPMTIAELEHLAPGFAWRVYLANAGFNALTRIVVAEKSAFPKLAANLCRYSISDVTGMGGLQDCGQ